MRDTEAVLTERQRKMIDEAEKSCARLVGLIAEHRGRFDPVLEIDGLGRARQQFVPAP